MKRLFSFIFILFISILFIFIQFIFISFFIYWFIHDTLIYLFIYLIIRFFICPFSIYYLFIDWLNDFFIHQFIYSSIQSFNIVFICPFFGNLLNHLIISNLFIFFLFNFLFYMTFLRQKKNKCILFKNIFFSRPYIFIILKWLLIDETICDGNIYK